MIAFPTFAATVTGAFGGPTAATNGLSGTVYRPERKN
jgi:hypothetical protein